MSVDRLFDVQNSFFLGHYQQCILEAQKLVTKIEEEKLAKDVFTYRSYIAQGKASVVLSEIPERTDNPALKAVRRLAEYQNAANKERIANQVQIEVSEGTTATDDTSCIVAALILNEEGNPEDAMRILAKSSSLEARSATVFTLLQMDRVDLAADDLNSRLKSLMDSHKLMLFMKGDRDQPQCEFSRAMVQLLNGVKADYGTFDILKDEEVRQGLRYTRTGPHIMFSVQLHLNGELLGGLDVVKAEMADENFISSLPKKS